MYSVWFHWQQETISLIIHLICTIFISDLKDRLTTTCREAHNNGQTVYGWGVFTFLSLQHMCYRLYAQQYVIRVRFQWGTSTQICPSFQESHYIVKVYVFVTLHLWERIILNTVFGIDVFYFLFNSYFVTTTLEILFSELCVRLEESIYGFCKKKILK